MSSNMSDVIVNYNAETPEAAEAFYKLFKENVSHEYMKYDSKEEHINVNGEPMGSYWQGLVQMAVSSEDLNNSLIQIDSVKNGLVSGSNEVYDQIYSDMRVEVVAENANKNLSHVHQMLQYQHNQLQEHERVIERLEAEVATLFEVKDQYEKRLEQMAYRFDQMYAYLHDVVNVTSLVRIVRELAEQVDPELLDQHTLHSVN